MLIVGYFVVVWWCGAVCRLVVGGLLLVVGCLLLDIVCWVAVDCWLSVVGGWRYVGC